MISFISKNVSTIASAALSAVLVTAVAITGLAAFTVSSDAIAAEKDESIAEVVSLGTRSTRPRTASDSTVPIDSISGDQFGIIGNSADITDNLKAYVPSYTATPATGDGSAFVRPTSLRGLAPDQTLVLINGKRRHRSALVHFFAPAAGNGAHGPDIGMIPSIALKRVDVLRDGASSQYGSDAIAGVMNFVLKDADEGGAFMAQYGEYFEGEMSYKTAANVGMATGDGGFLNISAEYVENEALSRGVQRPNAQALIDAGVTGVGSDTPFDDAPFTQTWGRPENGGIRFMANGGIDLKDDMQLYYHGNFADTWGTYRFFYRPGDNPATATTGTLKTGSTTQFVGDEAHISIHQLELLGYVGPLVSTGYTPWLEGDQIDLSLVTGLKGEMSGWDWDFSLAYGSNELQYTLNNTLNSSLGLVDLDPTAATNFVIPQRNFNVGAYKQSEININLDFSKLITDTVNLAYGFEWREETYEAIGGEISSYIGNGSNGLGGISPSDEGEFSRDNIAAYVEVEKEFSDKLLGQAAIRYEDFSDFGDTINGKLAARYRVSDATAIRGAVSTGFHAPTPGQANVTTTITTFDGGTGLQVEEGLVKSTSAIAVANGGAPLTEEESTNLSIGFTTSIGDDQTLTVDYYTIDIEGRIYRTGDITTGVPATPKISFYTNALDITSSGIDLVYSGSFDGIAAGMDVTLAANFNNISVTGQTPVGGINPVSEGDVQDIENNYPDTRFVLTTNTHLNDMWNLMVRANYYGAHFDERGIIGYIDGSGNGPSAEIDPIIYIDLEVGYQVDADLKVVFGGANIFDEFVDEINAPNANRQSVGLQYPRRTAANYEGGSWYLAAHYSF